MEMEKLTNTNRIKAKMVNRGILKKYYLYVILALDITACVLRYAVIKAISGNFVMESLCMVMLVLMSIFAFIDKEKSEVPDSLLSISLLLWVVMVGGYIVVYREEGIALLLFSLGGALLGGLIFLICYLVTKGQVGGGDVKLSFIMGLFLTIERILPAIIYGTLICSICSIILLIMKKTTLKSSIPLVPFLHIGVCITLAML